MDALAAQRAGTGSRGEVKAHAVELRGLTLRRSGRTVLADVSAAIEPGEFIGVFGPNGAGKTTLLHAILGLLRPAGGELRIFGAAPRRGSSAIGYLSQQRSSLSGLRLRGRDLVASAYRGERWGIPLLGAEGRREVDWAIDIVEAQALAERPVCELSGGELQRLLLAQALLGRPRFLLLDEPLVSLDPHFQQAVVTLVSRIRRELGTTVLFTAHDLNLLLGAMDRVLYLGQGQAALGTVDAVMTSEVLSRLYGMSIEVLRVKGRILVVSAHGEVEGEAHRHDGHHA